MRKNIRSRFWNPKVLMILGLIILVVLLFQTQSYRLKPKLEIPDAIKARLTALGQKSLQSNDVPVAAIVLYNDSIIGEGYNTVLRDSSISGHAEINALSQAFKHEGNTFRHLDPDKLALYSTFEPCEMCKGAIIHYGIHHIYFERTKPAFDQMKSTLKSLQYNLSIHRLDAPGLQEKLFRQHPGYPGR